jgi:hypothetical protein
MKLLPLQKIKHALARSQFGVEPKAGARARFPSSEKMNGP